MMLTDRDLDAEAAGWRQHADELGEFFLALANRRDAWGAYRAPEHRTADRQSTFTAPARDRRGQVLLDAGRLARHVRGLSQGDIVGLHAADTADQSKWAAFDLDVHGEGSLDLRLAVADAAEDLMERLAERGAAPLLEDSNGAGGFHVWVRFAEAAPTRDVFSLLERLATRASETHGVGVECFPKQATVAGRYGNWLRLPGRHHTRQHWSRVRRPGAPWASGADAARTILHHWPASPVSVVPPSAAWPASAIPSRRSSRASVDITTRAAALLRRQRPLRDGEGRNATAYAIAARVLHGLHGTPGDALVVLQIWNARHVEPLADDRLEQLVLNAQRYGRAA